MFRLLTICILTLSVFSGVSQNIGYTKSIVDTLSSAYFSGRGAVNDGEKKAAEFLKNEYLRIGLKPIENDFFQPFYYSINTFPGKLKVEIDGQLLVPGQDYIVEAGSGSVGGTFDLLWYYKENIPTKKELKKLVDRQFFANKFIVIDAAGIAEDNYSVKALKLNIYGAAGIIFLERTKLTQHLSQSYNDYGILRIKADKITRKNRKINVEIDHRFIQKQNSQNIIGMVKGEKHPDSIIIVSAHYDHLGTMGKEVYFPGANDNASGTAMLLNLAYHYTHKEVPNKTIVFMLFGAEEVGILGSKHFIEHPLFPLENINFVLNMDIMGTGDEGATIVNGAILPEQFELLQKINETEGYLPQIKKRSKAANSDHYWFTEKGIPAFFIYTLGGIKAYHDVDDRAETLPLTKFEDCFRLLRDFIDEL